jgi:hypothetical protein
MDSKKEKKETRIYVEESKVKIEAERGNKLSPPKKSFDIASILEEEIYWLKTRLR